ncbi:hypothetical protein BDP27DRAFT_1288825 [Rhodocollybia butyracea]|uniref:Amine oxidase domain-containing protein n=1 Tax=Rhodocollybia butyracea TaxID=206335 RepID=A0A9P5Q1Q0_9AGAR|nr:hypothetical protein BDP27DRAFT_1288825 [Rhodocollybia butyracea]
METNTPVHHWNSKQMIFDATGSMLSDEKTDRLSTLLWKIIEEAFEFSAKAHEKDGGKSILAGDSLYDFIKKRSIEELQDEQERETLLQMSEMWGAYVGEPVWKQSLRFAWMEECCGGEEMFVASDYSAIFGRISKTAKEEAKIMLGKKVVSVQTEDRSSGKQVSVTCDDVSTDQFDEVVMTTPLGWLKTHPNCFAPPLPPRLTSAIDNLKLSQLEKVFITFPSAFWISDSTTDSFPSYTNWLRPLYADDTNPHHWPQEIWNLASFTPPHNHPTILFYLYGDCSRHIVNAIYGKPKQEKHDFLDKFFFPYYSRLPRFDLENPSCTPKAILATEWLKDELNGYGSYCNFQTGVEEADKDVETFRDGCPERRLWFCGEHAAPFEECGTVAGAYLSGEFIGKKIVELYSANA